MKILKLFCLLAVAAAMPAQAEVTATTAQGFEIKQIHQIAATPAKVWDALVTPARWWNPEHSWSGNAANLSLEPKAGGCFCEKLAEGGSVRHLEVVFAAPGKLLRLSGALGPLQPEGLAGAMSFSLAEKDQATELSLTYKVGGYSSKPFSMWGPAVDGMLGEQMGRLKKLIETGKTP